jgi:hypothetical protein
MEGQAGLLRLALGLCCHWLGLVCRGKGAGGKGL